MELMFMISMNLTLLTMFLTHPLSIGLTLMIQTILMSIMSSMMKISSWYSFMLFIVMIGGMMVLFMYMTSIASNEKFSFKMNYMVILTSSAFTLYLMNKFNLSMYTNSLTISNKLFNIQDMFLKYWEMPMSTITILLFIYLLMTMVATVKITKVNNGPLRQMF